MNQTEIKTILVDRYRQWLYFSLLFAFSAVLLVLDYNHKASRLSTAYDGFIIVFQAVAFALLVWLTQISGLFVQEGATFAARWNWYLLPLCPVPLALYIYQKLSKNQDTAVHKARCVLRVYTMMLVLFMAATPLSSQLDLLHQLFTATIAVRCLSRLLFY